MSTAADRAVTGFMVFDDDGNVWPPGFKSALCDPGHPLCILTPAAIAGDAKAASRRDPVAYRFRPIGNGEVSSAERLWDHLRANGGEATQSEASKVIGHQPGKVAQILRPAIAAGVLVRSRENNVWMYRLGDTLPAGKQPLETKEGTAL